MPSPAYLAAVRCLRQLGTLQTGTPRRLRQGAAGPAPESDELRVRQPREPKPDKALDFEHRGGRR